MCCSKWAEMRPGVCSMLPLCKWALSWNGQASGLLLVDVDPSCLCGISKDGCLKQMRNDTIYTHAQYSDSPSAGPLHTYPCLSLRSADLQLGNWNINIHLNQNRLLWSTGVWCLVSDHDHLLLSLHSGRRLLLGGAMCARPSLPQMQRTSGAIPEYTRSNEWPKYKHQSTKTVLFLILVYMGFGGYFNRRAPY